MAGQLLATSAGSPAALASCQEEHAFVPDLDMNSMLHMSRNHDDTGVFFSIPPVAYVGLP